jgi:hypothetical protein
MTRAGNPVAECIDGAVGDWSMSGDAMRWSPELAERGPSAVGTGVLDGLEVATGFGATLGLEMTGMRRLVTGALSSLGSVAGEVVQELRELTRGSSSEDDALDR